MIAVMAKGEDCAIHRECDASLAKAFGVLGKRWNGLILGTLKEGPGGFAEIRRAIGPITDSVLSDRLAELTSAGLITREVTDSRPPGVSYALSPAGVALMPALDYLASWSRQHLEPQAEGHAQAGTRPPV
jgi:DNA-binding HxlR family transcriptional regulator